MKEQNPAVTAANQLREDEICCLVLRGTVTETEPLDAPDMTDITIDVNTVNDIPFSAVAVVNWFPMKGVDNLKVDDDVTIRVALVNPTSTANDTIKAKIDYVESIRESSFDDVSFSVDGIESTSDDGSFWTTLPEGSVNRDDEIRLRFEVISETDATATDETGDEPEPVVGMVMDHLEIDDPFGVSIVSFKAKAIGNAVIDVPCSLVIPAEFAHRFETIRVRTKRIFNGAEGGALSGVVTAFSPICALKSDHEIEGHYFVVVDVDTINGVKVARSGEFGIILPASDDLKVGDRIIFKTECEPGDK